MKTMAGIVVLAVVMLTGCGVPPTEAEPAQTGQDESGRVSAFATKDCSVSIHCADGTSRSCSGTNGACYASGSGNGSVTCNSSTYTCPSSLPTCATTAKCFSNADCGVDGVCQNNRCYCI
jgi:hypothetical protein